MMAKCAWWTRTGKELVKYGPEEYLDVVAEHIEPWTYLKFPYLKKVGWKGFVDGKDSGVYRASPLSRLNASDGMATPLAQEAYEKFYETLGRKTGACHPGDPLGTLDRDAVCGRAGAGIGHGSGDHIHECAHYPNRNTDRRHRDC